MAIEYKNTGLNAFNNALKQFAIKAEQCFLEDRANLLTKLTERVSALTPVWEGNTIANWRWSVGAPNLEIVEEAGQDIAPGETNKMALGSEPRRQINTKNVFTTLAEVILYAGFEDIYLSNPSEGAIPLEYGLWPGGKGQVSRSANGMLRLALFEMAKGYI